MSDELVERVAHAIMETRVQWGWAFGKRRRVMAIDLLMAEAAITAIGMPCEHEDAKRLSPEGVAARAEGIAHNEYLTLSNA